MEDPENITKIFRTAEHTKKYAEACCEVGASLKSVAVLDLWSIIIARCGWHPGQPLPGSKAAPKSAYLGELLHDGM